MGADGGKFDPCMTQDDGFEDIIAAMPEALNGILEGDEGQLC